MSLHFSLVRATPLSFISEKYVTVPNYTDYIFTLFSGKVDIYNRFGEMTTLHTTARDGFKRYNFKLIQLILGSLCQQSLL